MTIGLTEMILYVADQARSTAFYERLLQKQPVLAVPGMTEFQLTGNVKLGLMPNDGIARILSEKMPHPASGWGIPRCELYLHVENPDDEYTRAETIGATLIDGPSDRDWGDRVCYFADPDGHVIALARHIG